MIVIHNGDSFLYLELRSSKEVDEVEKCADVSDWCSVLYKSDIKETKPELCKNFVSVLEKCPKSCGIC